MAQLNSLMPTQNMNMPMPQQNNGMNWLQNQAALLGKNKLRTGKNPNPKFPRLRNAWENVKEAGGNIGAGGLGGAAGGAVLGSLVPGVGTALGAGLGAVGGGLYGLFGGDKGGKEFAFGTDAEQLPTVTPEQLNILQYLQQMGLLGLQNPYAGFDPIAQQSVNEFYEQDVPSLAERFTSMGDNALSSGTFSSQLSQGAAKLRENLAAQRAGYGQQNIQQALQLLSMGLQPQFQNAPGQPGVLPSLLGNAGNIYQTHQMNNLIKSLNNKGS